MCVFGASMMVSSSTIPPVGLSRLNHKHDLLAASWNQVALDLSRAV